MEGTRKQYQQIVQSLLTEYAQIPYLQESLTDETIFDEGSGRFLLVTVGWENEKRVNTIVLHLDIIGEQVWIQCNNTDQDIISELVSRGIERTNIVVPSTESTADIPQRAVDKFAVA